MIGRSPGRKRRPLRRGIIILPSAFTMANLYFGVYAIVAASRGEFEWAAWFVVFAGALDMLDGRIARFTRTGSDFGAELDSLVDAISFGVAPAFIVYQIYFADAAWSWLLALIYIMAVVTRLARFNVEQGGEAKRHFHGLPSPAAGMILATLYPFSQAPLAAPWLETLPWPQAVGVLVVFLSALMLSHVPYAVVPRLGFNNFRRIATTSGVLVGTVAAFAWPRYFIFCALLGYALWGFSRSVTLGLLDRLPDEDPLRDESDDDLDDAGAEVRELDYAELAPEAFRPPRGRREGGRSGRIPPAEGEGD